MYITNKTMLLGRILIAALVCVVLLAANVECGVDITFSTTQPNQDKTNPQYLPHEPFSMNWAVQLPPDSNSYDVSILGPVDKGINTVSGTYEGKLNSGTTATGSMTLKEGLDDGTYRVWLNTSPITSNIYLARIYVAPPTNIEIISYNDLNGNGIRDQGENGLSGWRFKIGKGEEIPSDYRVDSGEDGRLVIPISDQAVGDYKIEEILKDGWYNTSSLSKTISVVKGMLQ